MSAISLLMCSRFAMVSPSWTEVCCNFFSSAATRMARALAAAASSSVFSSVLRNTTRLRMPTLHFFLELAHFAGELIEAQDFLRAGLRLHDGVEQHHRAEAAADAVEERQREHFEGAALFFMSCARPRARRPPRKSA